MKVPRTLIVAGFALALLGAVTWAEWRDATRPPALADQVAHALEVQTNVSELLSQVEDIEVSARGFVMTGEPAFLERFLASLNAATRQLGVVRTVTRDNPTHQARCDVLERLITQKIADEQATVNVRRGAGFEAARQMVAGGQGTAVMDQIRAEIALMNAEERTLLDQRRAAARDQRRRARAVAATGSSLSFLILVAAFAAVWRENRLRRHAEQRLVEFNDQLEQRVREQTTKLEEASRISREAADRFRIIVEGIVDYAILMLDAGGHVISWNPGAERLKGYREEEIIGQHFSRFYPAEDVARGTPAKELEQAAALGRFEDEGWRVRKDGTRFWASVIMTALRDDTGQLRGFVKVTHDMSERRQRENALRISEQFLAHSQRLAHLGNWMADLETGRLTWSEELYRIYGVSPEAFVPTVDALLALIHPDDRSAMRSQIEALRSGTKPRPIEFRVIRADGTIRVVEGDGEIEFNAEHKPIRLVGTAQDITERKQTEEELRRSRDLLDQTGRMAKIGGWELDLKTQTLRWTMETYRIHEVSPALHPSVAEAIQYYAPEARPVIDAAVNAAIESGTPFDLELPLVTAHGRRIWVRAQGAAERHDGRTMRLYGAFQDITERKQAEHALLQREQWLSCIYETVADVLFYLEVEKDGRYRFASINQAFVSTTGLEPSQVVSKRVDEVVPEPSLTLVLEKYGEAIREKKMVRWEETSEYPRGRLTGEVSVVPVFDDAGNCTHLVGAVHDITERLRLDAQFRQAQKMESVGRLASGIAHDFNNLLTIINGMSELVLVQVGQDDPVHADVQEIHRAGERAATLTRQLLAFSRQQILEPRVLNVNSVVTGMESLLRRLLGEDIDLVVVAAPDLRNIKADPGQLEQVITNLAVNARDAMPQGGQLTIQSQNVEIDEGYSRQHGVAVPPGSYVRLVVSDSGVGMDEVTRARIFEPFFTTKGPGKGTGLGLSTVYGIVKQSQGFIWVYSEIGHGTSFTILLPQVTEATGTARATSTPAAGAGTETILLVEDNDGLRKLATRFLEPAGYTVLFAATGEEAMRLAESHKEPVHLLLSDVVMPGMSGSQLAERLRQTHSAMKVLYMSGYTDDTVVRHGVLGANVPFINKPFTKAALLGKVREVLDS